LTARPDGIKWLRKYDYVFNYTNKRNRGVISVLARATAGPREPFKPVIIERRELGPSDVLIDIVYAGICHSDIHHARSDWGEERYPLVPGHEIAGTVSAVGSGVTKFRVGDTVGMGCTVDSCRVCDNCRDSHLQDHRRAMFRSTYTPIPPRYPCPL